jgi:SAM-dependent methyltransferase
MSDDTLPIYMKPKDWAEAYESGTPHWAESREPSSLAVQLLQMLGKESGNDILEIGVGNGRDSIFFAKKGNRVVGIDIAPGAIEMAKKNARAADVDLIFQIGNAEKLEFADVSFDGIYSVSVLHATDLNLSFREIARVLRPHGKAILYLYEKTDKDGKEYWFMKREGVEGILLQNNFIIEDKWDFIHTGHEGEKTTVLIYKLNKEKEVSKE